MPQIRRRIAAPLVTVVLAVAACRGAPSPSTIPTTDGYYEPARALGPLYQEVQLARLFPDSKTFADSRPVVPPAEVLSRWAAAKTTPGYTLRAFVERTFELPKSAGEGVVQQGSSMEEHIRALWPVLTRQPDRPDPQSSLIPLPNAYVVPGGRFREVYYWDSYFTMLGLVRSGRTDLVKSMLDNFAHLVNTVGHVPNGNRAYYLGRSQPPFFAAMVGLYATATDTGQAYRRVVKLADGATLNRYWDDIPEPRPESWREDYQLGQSIPAERREALFRNIRASAESGWDFSSRWMRDPKDLRSLETTDLAPVDLNSLLYHAERTIAALHRFRGQGGDGDAAARFDAMAERRKAALLRAAFDDAAGYFYDVRWRTGERVTDRPTLAAAAPLYFGLATAMQGCRVAARLERDFLKSGGFVTTLVPSGQQWDAPNGWPPLQWLTMEGVRRYGRADLADTARTRWLALNRRVYGSTGKMTEKYDVMDPNRPAGGGEYPTQDGFGWSNGVALALSAQAAAPPKADTTKLCAVG